MFNYFFPFNLHETGVFLILHIRQSQDWKYWYITDPYSVLEYSDDEQEIITGRCSFDSIDWNEFNIFDRVPNKSFAQITEMSWQILKTLPADKLKELQCSYLLFRDIEKG